MQFPSVKMKNEISSTGKRMILEIMLHNITLSKTPFRSYMKSKFKKDTNKKVEW